jgi:hypothetical protein
MTAVAKEKIRWLSVSRPRTVRFRPGLECLEGRVLPGETLGALIALYFLEESGTNLTTDVNAPLDGAPEDSSLQQSFRSTELPLGHSLAEGIAVPNSGDPFRLNPTQQSDQSRPRSAGLEDFSRSSGFASPVGPVAAPPVRAVDISESVGPYGSLAGSPSLDPPKSGLAVALAGGKSFASASGGTLGSGQPQAVASLPAASAGVGPKTILIAGPVISQNKDLWYFNGAAPSNTAYALQVTLNAGGVGQNGTFVWKITAGTDKASFSNGKATITVVNSSATDLISKATSAPNTQDVTVTVTWNGVPGQGPLNTEVYTAYKLTHLSDVDSADANRGYSTEIHYSIKDQFNRVLPANIEINENWTSGLMVDFGGTNWNQADAGSATVAPANWADEIAGPSIAGPPVPVPVPQAPQNPLGNTAVVHWSGAWFVGSTTNGSGVKVQTNTWQLYQDHGRHTNVTSPP